MGGGEEMILIDEAVQRGIDAGSMLNDKGRKDISQLYQVYKLAEAAPDGPAVECGVYTGGSLICWAAAREGRGPLYAVDNWSSKNEQRFRDNLERFGLTDQVTVLGIETWRAPEIIEGEVAFCFHDAAHGIDGGFIKDLGHWWEKIMPGGILAFHDYDVWKPPVCIKAFVDPWQHYAQWEPLGLVGALIAFKRPLDG